MHKRQIEIVEFSEKIFHSGLNHKGLNGSLYEDLFLKILREEIPELDFYKGQIREMDKSSPQYDIVICRKDTPKIDFLQKVNPLINLVPLKDCIAVIELKKWANPKMISPDGDIQKAYSKFKAAYPHLKYFFVAIRFKDRKTGNSNWQNLKHGLNVDGKFCFFGRTDLINREWIYPWTDELISKFEAYYGEFERLINDIRNTTKSY